jgi:serine/threonine protein kinase
MTVLGVGSQGIVFLKDKVAIKRTITDNQTIKKEYQHLVNINSRLFEHPNIVKVHNFYNDSYSMEYLEGYKELENAFIDALTIEQKKSIFNQVYETMKDLHEINYVHGDLRMFSNIMYNEKLNNVKLIDFGYCENLSGTDTKTSLELIKRDYKHLWALKAKLKVQYF